MMFPLVEGNSSLQMMSLMFGLFVTTCSPTYRTPLLLAAVDDAHSSPKNKNTEKMVINLFVAITSQNKKVFQSNGNRPLPKVNKFKQVSEWSQGWGQVIHT